MADKKQDNKKPAQGQKGGQGQNQQQNANKAAAGKAAAAEAKAKAASKVELDDGKSTGEKVTIRLRDKFRSDVVPALMKEFNYANPMQVPSIKKVVVNIGLGEAVANAKALDAAVGDLTAITGQKPVINRAKKSIAAFKVRENMQIGASVTLRGAKMYEFLDRLVSVALPRVRDFSGVSNRAFDGHGNYTLGLREQIIFPEIDYDRVDKVRGMEITIVTSANTDEEGKKLLGLMGMPFRK